MSLRIYAIHVALYPTDLPFCTSIESSPSWVVNVRDASFAVEYTLTCAFAVPRDKLMFSMPKYEIVSLPLP